MSQDDKDLLSHRPAESTPSASRVSVPILRACAHGSLMPPSFLLPSHRPTFVVCSLTHLSTTPVCSLCRRLQARMSKTDEVVRESIRKNKRALVRAFNAEGDGRGASLGFMELRNRISEAGVCLSAQDFEAL